MRVNVAQLLKGTVGDARRYDIDEVIEGSFPVMGEAKLVLTNRSIFVTGAFKTVIHSTCSRCLKEFKNPLEFTIEEEFFPMGDILKVPAPPVEPEEKADGFVISEDHILDLSEALRQNLLLSIPTKPICQPECAGLCPKCGHDLNKSSCDCPDEQLDPRWSPLRQLLSDQTVKR